MRLMRFGLMLVCVFGLLVGCGPRRESTEDVAPTPTVEPVPTFTPTTMVEVVESVPTVSSAADDLSTTDDSSDVPDSEEPDVAADAEAVTDTLDIVTLNEADAVSSTTALTDVAESGVVSEAEASEPLLLLPTVTPVPEVAEGEPEMDMPQLTGPRLTVNVEAANVRAGPDLAHPTIDVALRDGVLAVTGRDATGEWWQACCFGEQPGWLFHTLVTVEGVDAVEVVEGPPLPQVDDQVEEVVDAPVVENEPEEVAGAPETAAPDAEAVAPGPGEHSGTAGNFDPNSQYQIVHYRVLGFDDNNGGIFNKGGQQFIFLTVLDPGGNPLDGVVVKDAVGDKLTVVTGEKGPGKVEIKMDWDPYKLYVASDSSGPVTSQVSNQMNNPYPHIPDVVGMLGPPENEYAICPTIDDRCTPPFYHAHWSYEITFQKVR